MEDPIDDPLDFELGERVEVTINRRPGAVVSIRLDHEAANRLCAVADASGRTLTQVATDALRAYLETQTTTPVEESGSRRATAKAT